MASAARREGPVAGGLVGLDLGEGRRGADQRCLSLGHAPRAPRVPGRFFGTEQRVLHGAAGPLRLAHALAPHPEGAEGVDGGAATLQARLLESRVAVQEELRFVALVVARAGHEGDEEQREATHGRGLAGPGGWILSCAPRRLRAVSPVPLHGLTCDAVRALARERVGRGHGKARDIYRATLREGRFDPASHGLGEAPARRWREVFGFVLPEVVQEVREEGPTGVTAKAVLRTPDGLEHECVNIPMGRGRHTLCLSSQVGCKMGCAFCETGRMGLLRHLRAHEIVGQVLVARHVLGWEVRNVVFMGMGEALDNADAVLAALRVLNDPSGMAMGQERITVCTVGHLRGLRQLREAGFKRLNLSVSLNTPDDVRRSELMPVNRKTPLRELQAELAAYRPRRNFTLGVNYCLMPGLNDTREDAAGVAAFCAPIERVMLNVIPYNPGNAPLTRAPTEDEVEQFIGWLRDEGLPVRRRVTKGRSVMAACGQLGNAELRARRRGLPTLR